MAKTAKWFEVDADGLRRQAGERAPEVIANELVANAFDADGVTCVEVRVDHTGQTITVVDDGKRPWLDLAHAWTLFARSARAADGERRGRFNLGEKLVLSMCMSARISTMAGSVSFDVDGRRRRSSTGTAIGTAVELKLRRQVRARDVVLAARRILPPEGVAYVVDGQQVHAPDLVSTVEATLPTVTEGEDGELRRTRRLCKVEVFSGSVDGDGAWLYEMGVPVCRLEGDQYSVNVYQKVPLPPSRDSVTPAYHKAIRTLVLDLVADGLTADEAAESWVADAMDMAQPQAVERVVRARYGEKAVVFDPSDPEANKRAASAGYNVIHGGAFSGAAWNTIREAGIVKPAGQVTPSPKTGFSAGGAPPTECKQITAGMQRFAELVDEVAAVTIGRRPGVDFYVEPTLPHGACFGPGDSMGVNVGRLGYGWFDMVQWDKTLERWLDLIIHELGHEWAGDHLSEEYYGALTKIGARLAAATYNGMVRMRPDVNPHTI